MQHEGICANMCAVLWEITWQGCRAGLAHGKWGETQAVPQSKLNQYLLMCKRASDLDLRHMRQSLNAATGKISISTIFYVQYELCALFCLFIS